MDDGDVRRASRDSRAAARRLAGRQRAGGAAFDTQVSRKSEHGRSSCEPVGPGELAGRPGHGVGGLTARVFVNRFWYLLFGHGIAPSLDDFGGQGQPPTHPELLDQLTLDFIDDGWSIKRLMRRIVLSRTYRQTSDASEPIVSRDPFNLWFARQSRYRLPAEMVRDNALIDRRTVGS